MTILAIILLIAIGIALLILEILVLPGLIAGIIGGVFILAGVLITYSNYGSEAGHITAILSAVISSATVIYFLRSKSWQRFGLNSKLEGKTNEVDKLPVAEGDYGITISALRPMGTIMVGNIRIEAQTKGEMIAENTQVKIIRVLPNKVLVEAV
ncbi:MAG: NfeD family protein [Bacteroidia bacterium]|nr:NfeD family protein [Bacteroidia bacterium]